jgi:hypothetical protein
MYICDRLIPPWIVLRNINVSDKSFKENQNTFYVHFFSKSCFCERYNPKKNGRSRQASNAIIWSMRFACCVNKTTDTHTHTHTHTLRTCNTCCLSTATVVNLMRQIATLRVHCLSSYTLLSFKGLTTTELAVMALDHCYALLFSTH